MAHNEQDHLTLDQFVEQMKQKLRKVKGNENSIKKVKAAIELIELDTDSKFNETRLHTSE